MSEKKPTAGQIIADIMSKQPDQIRAADLARDALMKDYVPNVVKATEAGMRKWFNRDFYVTVLSRRHKTLQDVLHFSYFPQLSCPTPNYSQTVYRYVCAKRDLELIWSIPDKEACLMYIENQAIIHPEEYPILQNVLAYKSGDLFKKCKELNNERMDSNILNTTDMHKVSKIIH